MLLVPMQQSAILRVYLAIFQVEEIMLTLKQAFHSAFQQTSKHHIVCELCPMHQLHKLCQQIEGRLIHVNMVFAFCRTFRVSVK